MSAPPAHSTASLDGVVGPARETYISVTDEGLLRGDGVFEVARLYAGRPFALEDHFARMGRSAAGLHLPADLALLRDEVAALLEAVGPLDGLLRLVLTRGGRRIAIVEPLPAPLVAARVATVPHAPSRVLDGLKTLSYAGNMLAVRLAQERGYDDALFVTPHGRVLEGPTWTLFWAAGGELYTPPLEERILSSITRARILDAYGGSERITTLDDLAGAQEAFIASSVREVLPIARIDEMPLPAAPGPVTEAASAALQERIAAELAAEGARG